MALRLRIVGPAKPVDVILDGGTAGAIIRPHRIGVRQCSIVCSNMYGRPG